MVLLTGWREPLRRIGFIVFPAFLLIGALLPGLSLIYLRADLTFLPQSRLMVPLLLIVCPLSTFLLAIFLWRARFRIVHLEAREAEATESARLDPLSGLPNRLYLDRLLERQIPRASLESPIALIAIDVDKFKSVNDTHGHDAGDRLIVGIAGRIRRIIREGDCLARVGGDEFVLMLVNCGGMRECAAMVHRIHDAMIAPFDIGRAHVNSTLSIGIALCPQDGETNAALKQAADLALYRAKEEGRNRFAFFDKTMQQTLHIGVTIEGDLRAAIMSDALTVLYQPVISACGRRVVGLEALVRWQHPQFGTLAPEEFIPVAESRGLIAPLGEWVLARACRDARRWPHLRMAVNVSPVQVRQRDFVATVQSIIAGSGIDPARLDLDLTEGVLIQDADQAEDVIMDLRALGVRMGLDDFGAGYSSMIYLRRFALDKIKIDRAFLGALEPSGEGGIILGSIVSLGHALGLSVTAEGVEHPNQMAFLQKLGCDEMQGFLFSQPVDADGVDAYLAAASTGATLAPDRDPATDAYSVEASRSAA